MHFRTGEIGPLRSKRRRPSQGERIPIEVHRMTLHCVLVDGFSSVSVYNGEGYFEATDQGVYSVDSVTAKHDRHGAVTRQFCGCDSPGAVANCPPISADWNYLVRRRQPQRQIPTGEWTPRPGFTRFRSRGRVLSSPSQGPLLGELHLLTVADGFHRPPLQEPKAP